MDVLESLLTHFFWFAFFDRASMVSWLILALTSISIVWLALWLLSQYLGLLAPSGGLRMLRLKRRRACASLRGFMLRLYPARQR
jgi:hypothetical protein